MADAPVSADPFAISKISEKPARPIIRGLELAPSHVSERRDRRGVPFAKSDDDTPDGQAILR